MVGKSALAVNFINIYKQLLHQYSFAKKIQSKNVIREELCKILSYVKVSSKTLVKLTPVKESIFE